MTEAYIVGTAPIEMKNTTVTIEIETLIIDKYQIPILKLSNLISFSIEPPFA